MRKLWWPQNRFFYTKPFKIYVVLIVVFSVLVWYVFYVKPISFLFKNSAPKVSNHLFEEFRRTNDKETPFKGAKIVHIDLKGAPPKVSYYKSLFPLLKKIGATGILMEYEDMFPYKTSLAKNISALNAYTLDDIKTINQLAQVNELEVIPLLQTFGHLEFLLKLEEYSELREVSEYPQVICPTHEKSLKIITEMVNQVIEMHPQSKIIHIGADEVYYIGFCDRCVATMSKFNLSKSNLFFEHINAIAKYIHEKHPHLKILMWDDEFRSLTTKELKEGRLTANIEPVVWKYARDVYEELGPSLWDMYSEVFPKVWAASAFKGATGEPT